MSEPEQVEMTEDERAEWVAQCAHGIVHQLSLQGFQPADLVSVLQTATGVVVGATVKLEHFDGALERCVKNVEIHARAQRDLRIMGGMPQGTA